MTDKARFFGYPNMGRYGLGHSLLAWARCVVWCEQTGAKMLAPRWLRFRIGPYLRSERDKREYFRLFNNHGLIGEPLRSWHLLTSDRIVGKDGYFDEDIFSESFINKCRIKQGKTVVVFENSLANNTGKHFSNVLGYSELLNRRFRQIVRPIYLPRKVDPHSVAIHVRMGDFQIANDNETLQNSNTRQPVNWYKTILSKLREELKYNVPAIVYSDGTDKELAPLLQLPAVKRASKQESVTDLLSITEAPVLIASGSGFSLWGAFLGQVPTIYYPGCKIITLLKKKELVIEADGLEKFPHSFIEHIATTLKNPTLDLNTSL